MENLLFQLKTSPWKDKILENFFQTTQHLITCDFIDIISPVFIRYHKNGQSLLVLLPSEESEMITALEANKIPINKIRYCSASWYYIKFSDMHFQFFFFNFSSFFTLLSCLVFNNKVEKEFIATKFWGVICDCWILPLVILGHIYNHWQSVQCWRSFDTKM